MQNRIRVGVLIFKENKILLVKHVHPETGYTWWVPPGGGIKDKETIFEAAIREVHEETGLKVKLNKIVYLRQFIYNEFKQNNIDIYLISKLSKGTETIENIYGKGNDENFIKELKYFSKSDLKLINVFPSILKDQMWEAKKKRFAKIRFFGVETDKN